VWDQWNTIFYKVLEHAERSLVSELRDTRNKWAHQKAFSIDNLYRAVMQSSNCRPILVVAKLTHCWLFITFFPAL
jgi:hypothetical protein